MNQTRSEITHQNILLASAECFSHSGYDATGVAEICHSAGVSKGAFYHHFPSKQAVFLELLENWLLELENSIITMTDLSKPVPDLLMEMAGMIHAQLENNPYLPVYLEVWRQANRDEIIRRMAMAPYDHFKSILAGLINKGMQEGSLEPGNADAVAQAFVSLASGLFLQKLIDPDSLQEDAIIEASIRTLIQGILRRSL